MKTFHFRFIFFSLCSCGWWEMEEAILSHLILFTCEKESNGGESKRVSALPRSLFDFPARQNKTSLAVSSRGKSHFHGFGQEARLSTDPISSSWAVTICAECCTQGVKTLRQQSARLCSLRPLVSGSLSALLSSPGVPYRT